MVYFDAVQYAPHGPIDVQKLDCDFLISSAYKFFGTHAGILYGKREYLEKLFAYKVRPATNDCRGSGKQAHKTMKGLRACLEPSNISNGSARNLGVNNWKGWVGQGYQGRRMELKQAMVAIHAHEFELSRALLGALQSVPGLTIYGLADVHRLEERVPTFSFRLKDLPPQIIAEKLAQEGIYVWDGNYYAINVTEQLGLEDKGGMVRVGAVHYNTLQEVERLKTH